MQDNLQSAITLEQQHRSYLLWNLYCYYKNKDNIMDK